MKKLQTIAAGASNMIPELLDVFLLVGGDPFRIDWINIFNLKLERQVRRFDIAAASFVLLR